MRRLALLFTVAVAVSTVVAAGAKPASRLSSAQKARLYHRWAEEALAETSVEARQRAVRNLALAIDLEPHNPAHWLLLGKVKLLGEFESEARECFRRAVVLDPMSPAGYSELGMSWKREWLQRLDTLALERAIANFDSATVFSPYAADLWLQLVPLRYERCDLVGAAEAAARALSGRPRRPEVPLAAAYVAHRRGEIERADSLFRSALPRLDAGLRALFQDPGRWMGAATVGERGPWDGLDPDPTTPENEIQLEYWSRVAHALLLFHDPLRPGVDFRAETYMRYGAPQRSELNPLGAALETRSFASRLRAPMTREAQSGGSPWRPPPDFPVQVQAWYYPELGMRVLMQDRSLHGRFEPEFRPDDDPTSRPEPGLLAERGDLMALGRGFAVFSKLPPPGQRLEVQGLVARFEGDRGPRLFAQIESPGTPAETLTARWVVDDLEGRRIARGAQTLELAACDPGARQAAQISADLPAGAYRISVSVRDGRNRRGLYQEQVGLARSGATLELSDLVLTCDDPGLLVAKRTARFDALVTTRVASSRPLVAYLEIYRLAAGEDGVSRFEYVCEVRHAGTGRARDAKDRQALISISREEVHLGPVRRQFVSVPLHTLGKGRFRLDVRVRDLLGGETMARSAEFVRE